MSAVVAAFHGAGGYVNRLCRGVRRLFIERGWPHSTVRGVMSRERRERGGDSCHPA